MQQNWMQLNYRGEKLLLEEVPSESSKFTVGFRYGSGSERGHVVLCKGGETLLHRRASEPRSVGVSDTGRMVFADWIEYGESTGAEVEVYDTTGNQLYAEHYSGSSPLVDISAGGEYIVVCPYGGKVFIESIDTGLTIAVHEYDIADRLTPKFITNGGQEVIEFSDTPDSLPLYRIDFEGNVCWQSETFEERQYYQVVTLDESVSWEPMIQKCAEDYRAADNGNLQNLIANKIGDARLVDATQDDLKKIIATLENHRDTFTAEPTHSKLVSQTLGEAYYRLAKCKETTPPSEKFWTLIKQSGEAYRTVLPWYAGKHELARVLRYQAKQYRKQQRPQEAYDCYLQIEALEQQFNVELKSKADQKYLDRYDDQGVSSNKPRETGRLVTNHHMFV